MSKDSVFLALRLKEVALKHIGNIKIHRINQRHGTAEYGIMVGDRSAWGKGYAREATIALINHCFNNMGLRKVVLGVVSENSRAYDLYKRLGFSEEGILKRHYFNGTFYYDEIRMAVFKELWQW